MKTRLFSLSVPGMSIGLATALILLLPSWSSQNVNSFPDAQLSPRPYLLGSIASGTRPVPETYGKLPLSFEANQGQSSREVKFLSRGSGYTLFLTSNEAVLALKKERPGLKDDSEAPDSHFASADKGPAEVAEYLRMKLVGANPSSPVSGGDELPGKSNYFIGKDPTKWRVNIANYAKVKYQQVYPGVDLVYYGNQHQLEYDFVVAPGADPRTIQLGFSGVDKLRVDQQGALVLEANNGEVRLEPPQLYQVVEGTRQKVDGRYFLMVGNKIGFEVRKYDSSRSLVIDPVLTYSTYLGGSGNDSGLGIAVDSAGNAYVTGGTSSINFPTTNPFQTGNGGGSGTTFDDAFVTKINASGSAVVYSTYLGGSGEDVSYGIAVDSASNAYVTGFTQSSNFPTANAIQSKLAGADNAFVTKINASGAALVYSTYLGGSISDAGRAIAVDSTGNAYVTGVAQSSNFPTANAIQPTLRGGTGNAFVTKINANGSAFIYSTYLGGAGPGFGGPNDEGFGIAADSAGNAYVTGFTNSTSFPTANALQATFGGGSSSIGGAFPPPGDAFVTKINANGSALIYSTYLGGSGDDAGFAIAVDSAGNAYVTGYTQSPNFPMVNAFQATLPGTFNAFVTKINSNGSALTYSTYLGGSGFDMGLGIAVDSTGNAHVTGSTVSLDFPTVDAFIANSPEQSNAFVTKISVNGSTLLYSTYLGGTDNSQQANGIAVDSAGNAYVTGSTAATDFPVPNGIQTTYGGGGNDAFVAKILPLTVMSLSPRGLTFGNQPGGTVSSPQRLTLTNDGAITLDIASIRTTGLDGSEFSHTTSCGTSLVVGGSCTIDVTFAPTPGTAGVRFAALTVVDAATGSPQSVPLTGRGIAVPGDFDGDGKADIAVWRLSGGDWFIIPSSNPNAMTLRQWGTQGDIPVPGDYDGDGRTDIAIWRPSDGTWFIMPSINPSASIIRQWGTQEDIPVQGDYDGDGKTDLAVFRPSNGTWFIIPSSNPSVPIVRQWGTAGDIPVPGDYDGDGKTDFAVFRPSNGTWFIIPSSNPSVPIIRQWGTAGDIPVPGDYDGDGKTDVAVFRPSNGMWFITPSGNPSAPMLQQWGTQGDIPVPADYDRNRKTDIAVWRPANGVWYIIPSSTSSTFTMTQWGTNGDVPVQKPIGQ